MMTSSCSGSCWREHFHGVDQPEGGFFQAAGSSMTSRVVRDGGNGSSGESG